MFHKLALCNVFTGKFSRIPQNTKHLLISALVVSFRNYFVLATPYGAELILAINSSQLVKIFPFLLKKTRFVNINY